MQNTLFSGTVEESMNSDPTTIFPETRSREIDFSIVYQRYATPIYRYAIARVGSRADAEDVTSQVFMDALNGWKRFKVGGNIPAWLFTIARNKIVDRYRWEKRNVPLEESSSPIVKLEMLKRVTDAETTAKLNQVLSSLPPEQQELLQLRFAGELTYRQISEVMGKSEAAVKMAIHRLLDQLQQLMEQDDE